MTEARRSLAKESLMSLHASVKHLPCEIIVADNGGHIDDSKFFLELADKGIIQHYIRNHSNIWFGRARNKAIEMSEGEIICVMDNDLFYTKGWLEMNVESLKKTRGNKLLSTPMGIRGCHKKYTDEREIGGEKFVVNPFAGSNCWLMWREDWIGIGKFADHWLAGTLWCRTYGRQGYSVVTFSDRLVSDEGDKRTVSYGYRIHHNRVGDKGIRITKTLTDGSEILYGENGVN